MAKGKFNLSIKRELRNIIYLGIIFSLLVGIVVLDIRMLIPSIAIFVILVLIEIYMYKKYVDQMHVYFDNIIDDLNIVTKTTLLNSPLPLIIAKIDGKIIWKSQKYIEEIEALEIEKQIEKIINEIKQEILVFDENKDKIIEDSQYIIRKELKINDKNYEILGKYVENIGKNKTKDKEYIVTLFFIDRSRYYNLLKDYDDEKLVLALVEVDNYDEEFAKVSLVEKPRIMAEIEREIYNWANSKGGIVLKTELNEFLCVFEKKALISLREDKFSILENVKNIQNDARNAFTLSIAVNADGENLREIFRNTVALRDIVLGRGGDQAAIKENNEHRFYGAKTIEVEKRTRVKARVISRAIIDKIRGVSSVIIMGHKGADIDAIGSAIGMYRFIKKYNNDVYIVSKLDSLGLRNI